MSDYPTIAELRTTLAAAVSAVSVPGTPDIDVTVYPRTEPRAGQGWTQPPSLEPGGFGGVHNATVAVLVALSDDVRRADELYTAWASAVFTAATSAVPAADATVTPEQVSAGDSSPAAFYVLVVTLTTEVQ